MSLYLPQSSGSPESKLSWPSMLYVLWACLSSAGVSGCRACSWGSTSGIVIIPFVGCLPQVMGLNCTGSPLFPSTLLWFLLYIFSCRRSFLLVFWSLSSIVSVYIIVILVFPWKEVSSGSSYSAMWTIPSLFTFYSFFPSLNDLKWTLFKFADFFFCQIASVVLFVTFSIELLYYSSLLGCYL